MAKQSEWPLVLRAGDNADETVNDDDDDDELDRDCFFIYLFLHSLLVVSLDVSSAMCGVDRSTIDTHTNKYFIYLYLL